MYPLDTRQREKWPAPSGRPDPDLTRAELAAAREQVSTDPERAKARAVLALLREAYGEPSWPVLDPLGQLVEVLLSHRTTDPVAWNAYNELRRRFPTWEAVRDAPVEEIIDAIGGTTWPDQKAYRIKAALQKITGERGSLDLGFLCQMPVEEAAAWLERLEGVGPKSAACVLLFACHLPDLPVDTHLHRVGMRLGLIGPNVSAGDAHGLLQSLLPEPRDAYQVLTFHRDMLLHGQRICVWRDPKCPQCVLRDWCDYYSSHPEKHAPTDR